MTSADINNAAERMYAETLDAKGIAWERPKCRTFVLSGTSYTPDFYLPDSDVYVEVIGTRQRWLALRFKLAAVRTAYPQAKLLVVHGDGRPYDDLTSHGGDDGLDGLETTYLLRNIPEDEWRRVKERAAQKGESVRAAILRMLEQYVS